ncbi:MULTISPECIES: benzoate/H(+) symporter BenE family transporter [Brevundimonas]|uniref:benzoate/H(+) symporter BenE family transporter n=1 Tax=Brevundimonas TaxID=41275 RepID=UPI001903CE70|nr:MULTISPECIES: benzoate/H(+) symporter BenE family transporter [Brevundimonas]MDA0744553.1 benzoate/H(+) symporter BenE family transporter [Pseudomonadota bacterium]MBK1970177.1 benzoate/H(+) symporter BenE family transporter [Brevundimonas diminuta]MBK1976411.1 benzoate/H(+) symporter BenE family transporter [Brevundimonas diminuta]MDA1322633.1 benzoate/H(+) symporter BenE family transporter [Pseudomonadota bacterium]MDM8352472.1 benzoate/H(+) symporter BenE family transporter [Brevundimona
MSSIRLPPPASFSAAAVATVVGFGGTVALVVQAGQAMGAAPAQIISMVTALCLGIGLPGAVLSWRLKMPVVLAWSTPGAALLAASTLGLGWSTAVGAFVIAGLMMVLTGLVPTLGRLAERIPAAVASAMLAGVLLPFCLRLFLVFPTDLMLAAGLLLVFLVMRQLAPAWSLPAVLVAAFAVLTLRGQVALPEGTGLFGALSPVMPAFDWKAAVSLALPLYLVTLASQNLPGLVVLRAAGYAPPAGKLIFWGGLTSTLLAPFGAHGVNLAAITAAICTEPDAHPDAAKRWTVGVIYGLFYLVVALFAAPLAGLFIAMPTGALAAITGLALIAPLTGSLGAMMGEAKDREAAVLTFAATASGVALFGVGSAFWGLAVGFLALAARRWIPARG